MPDASPEYFIAAEVHDVAPAAIIGAAKMLPKLFFAEIAEDDDFSTRISPRDLGHSSNVRPKMHTPVQHRPVPASSALRTCRIPQRPIHVGNGGGPAARPIRLPCELPVKCGRHRQTPGALNELWRATDRGSNGLRRYLGLGDDQGTGAEQTGDKDASDTNKKVFAVHGSRANLT